MPSATIYFDHQGNVAGIDIQAETEQQEKALKKALNKLVRLPFKIRIALFLRDCLAEIGTRLPYCEGLSKLIDRLAVYAEDGHVC